MTNCLFFAVIFTLFLNVSFGSLRYSQINRTFMTTYKGLFEASAISVGDNGEPIKPIFDYNTLKNYLSTYLEPNIKRYTKEYTLELKQDSKDKSYVDVKLDAKINYLFHYSKSVTFFVQEQSNE